MEMFANKEIIKEKQEENHEERQKQTKRKIKLIKEESKEEESKEEEIKKKKLELWDSVRITLEKTHVLDNVEIILKKTHTLLGTVVSETRFDPICIILDESMQLENDEIRKILGRKSTKINISKDKCEKISQEYRIGAVVCHKNFNVGIPVKVLKGTWSDTTKVVTRIIEDELTQRVTGYVVAADEVTPSTEIINLIPGMHHMRFI